MLVPTNLKVDRMEEQRTYFIDIAVSFAYTISQDRIYSFNPIYGLRGQGGEGWGE